ncbi:MAG TPA: protein-glutamate O-methyltransferase CheR [Polyangia bacterium]|nr:protein-glutamate O-methyltransferase CheR [Polyangia bacterium]
MNPARDPLAAPSPQPLTEISDDEFMLFQALICREAGIHLAPTKKPMLVSRLMRRVASLKLPTFRDYYHHVLRDGSEMVRLIDAVCTNETWFFRNPKHFSFLKETLCPAWLAEAEAGRRPRRVSLWSAASSSGEEPFSLAMVLLDALPGWELQILATDLSSRILERAREATWPLEKSGDIPPSYLKRFMLRGTGAQEGKMRAGAEIRNLVTFRRLNLNDEMWALEPEVKFEAVFCRNVLMYFELGRRDQALRKILKRLSPQGYLFLGDAEGLNGFNALKMVAPSVHTFRNNAAALRGTHERPAVKEDES